MIIIKIIWHLFTYLILMKTDIAIFLDTTIPSQIINYKLL